MAIYRNCPECGAALDPGEKCDCYMIAAARSGNARSETQETRSDSIYLSRAGADQRQDQRPRRIIYDH